MKVAALIPRRTGSKGIPGKNFKIFNGMHLWGWSFNAAYASGIFDKIIVSTNGGLTSGGVPPSDDRIIFDNNRPERYSTDESNLDELLVHYARENQEIQMWCLLQPTSPLRTAKDIQKAYKLAMKDKFDSIVSVTPNPCMFWVEKAVGIRDKDYCIATYHVAKRPNRQDRKDWNMENGAIYFTKKYVLEQTGCRLGGSIGLYKMPQERSFEIDSPTDWKIAEFVAKGGLKNGVA
jgi:N-acylneuraminate cytidylyltransferase